MKRLIAALLLSFIVFSMVSCAQNEPAAQIAATTLPVYDLTRYLCQDTNLSVARIITDSVSCLHNYTLSVRQVKTAEQAQTIVISGGGLEDFMSDLLSSQEHIIDASQGLHAAHSDHGHSHEFDPHFWLSPEHAKHMAENICAGLAQQYPANRDAFNRNLAALQKELDELQTYGKEQLSNLSCRKLITFHDGFSYFAEAFDLTILKAIEEESGSEASASELKELIQLQQLHDLPAVFVEQNGSVSAANILNSETGVKIFKLDMAISGNDYFSAMYQNIDTIKEAMG